MRFSYHGIIGGSGECNFHITDSIASATAQLGVAAGKFVLADALASADFHTVHSDCSGVSGAIINVIIDVLQGTVTSQLADATKAALIAELKNTLGPDLAKLPLDLPMNNGFATARFDATFATLAPGAKGPAGGVVLLLRVRDLEG